MKKVALYDPYLNILGGGERYVLSILKVFESHGYECSIFWNTDVTKKIKQKFGIKFHTLNFIPHIFPSSPLKTLQALRTFDSFIYVTNGSYFFSSAKHNYIYAMVPQKILYPQSLLHRLKTLNYTFITHSKFTKKHLADWNIQTKLLYPYINIPTKISLFKKEKTILCVGRFFKHLHSKRHDIAIKVFSLLKKNPLFRDYKLIIAGGLQKEDKDYFNSLKNLAKNDSSILFKPNISFYELYKVYRLSTFYWHFAGFGIDEDRHPELVEHMGIAPLEAMAYGVIPFCYNAGGPKEIISQGENGFLFKSEDEFIKQMINIVKKQDYLQSIQIKSMKFACKNFSYPVFEKRVKEIFF